MFELTDLVCKTHPGSKIEGDPSWFPIEEGKWTWDTNELKCSHWSGSESCTFAVTIHVETPPGTHWQHKWVETI